MTNYSVVGVGYFNTKLTCFMNVHDDAKIICVCGPGDGENIVRELQCTNMLSLDALVSSKLVDCVIVAAPNYLYKEPIIKTTKNKEHVFCEKPIVSSYEDCMDMVEARKETDMTFMAGHIMDFFDEIRYARKLTREGVIGEISSCHTRRNGWENK